MPLESPWFEPIPRFLRRADWTEEEWATYRAARALPVAVEAPRTDLPMPARKRRRKRKTA